MTNARSTKTPSVKATSATKARSRPQASQVDHGQRRKLVADALLSDIFHGHWPAGSRLVIHDLAERYGVSPTPIREALVTLEGIGIVDIAPNCGAVVRRVTTADVKEVCVVRRALECAAVKLACGRADIAELQSLAAAFRRQARLKLSSTSQRTTPTRSAQKAIEQAREFDSRLHDRIAEWSGNRFLAKELGRLKLLFRSFRDVAWDQRLTAQDFARCAEEANEHLAIVEALLANDSVGAVRAMAQHIRAGVKYWSRGLPHG